MAETKPTATTAVKSSTSVQPKKSGNFIVTIAPIACIVLGYVIWRFVLGNASNFTNPDKNGGFWPNHQGPIGSLTKMYEGHFRY
jgi:biopolymer transport protein ExbB